jgi:hypothetical protein
MLHSPLGNDELTLRRPCPGVTELISASTELFSHFMFQPEVMVCWDTKQISRAARISEVLKMKQPEAH